MPERAIHRSGRWRWMRAAFGLFLLGAACSDSPSAPNRPNPTSIWVDVELPGGIGSGGLMDLAFSGERGFAVGTERTAARRARRAREIPGTENAFRALLLETTGQGWSVVRPAAVPESALFLGVAFSRSGHAVLAGADTHLNPVLLDERNGWQAITPAGLTGFLWSVASSPSGVLRAVGVSSSGNALVSTSPHSWVAEDAGFSTSPNDKGLVDLAFANGAFYGCGYDDAGPPYRVVMKNDGSGWTPVDYPGDHSNRDLNAIAAGPDGSLFVGGAITDFSTGSPDEYVAFLSIRSSTGEWIEVVLPEAGLLDQVNDVLVASNGDVYLACGMDMSWILRSTALGIENEGPERLGQILALEEGPAGVLYAAGFRLDDQGQETPMLLRRERR